MYDGTVGVIGAIAALKALNSIGFKPQRPLIAMMFTSEEPTRFGLGCIGRQAEPPLLLSACLSKHNGRFIRIFKTL